MSARGDRPLVLLDATPVDQSPTGVGNSIIDLIGALSREDRGLDFLVACRHADLFPGLAQQPGWALHIPAYARYGGFSRLKWLMRDLPVLARKHHAALVHTMTFPAPWRISCPLVMTVHDIAFHLFPETIETRRRLWYEGAVPPSIRRADRILVNSRTTARELTTHFPRARGKTVATVFGAPSWLGEPTARSGSDPSAPFLFVGALEPRKNLLRILEAHTLYRHYRPDLSGVSLEIVGAPGWRCDTIIEAVERLSAAGTLRWRQYCKRDDLAGIYARAKALVFPSLHEGFGFPILEAMTAGLPVITSDRGAMKEIAGEAALLVDPMSVREITGAMLKIDSDIDFALERSRAGSKRVRDFSWLETANATTEVYKELCGP